MRTVQQAHSDSANARPVLPTAVANRPARLGQRLPIILAVLLTVAAQGLLGAAIAMGTDPVIGAASAIAITLCGLMVLLAAAGLQR